MSKTYKTREVIPADHSVHKDFAYLSPLMKDVLYHRGIRTAREAEVFLHPDWSRDVHDPFLMKDMDKAVEKILKVMDAGDKIVVYSDYDADGIPAAVVMSDFFNKIGYKNVQIYIPHRHDEGFGLNHEAIGSFAGSDTKLLITLDCGIADVAEVAHANKLGIEVIVTDHHLPGAVLPEAYAILDPKQPGCTYPDKALCGSGVAFKLVQALLSKRRTEWNVKEGWEKWLLDMVGMATVSDMVSLRGENRAFASFGLTVLRKSPRAGLQALLTRAGVDQRLLTEDDIGFTISPRINAASRMGVSEDAFKLLSTANHTEAEVLSERLEDINTERKGLIASMVREMKKKIRERYPDAIPPVLVLGNPDWRPSLLGLAANSLAEEYSRPAFLWGRDGGGILKGSCRSSGRVNLYELMTIAGHDTFLEFGGHAYSGGFSVTPENIHTLEEKLVSAFGKIPKTEDLIEDGFVDSILTPEEVTIKLFQELEAVGPFGMDNPKPIFLFKDVDIKEAGRFGKTNNHLKIIIPRGSGGPLSAIQFFVSDETFAMVEGKKSVSFVATLEKSCFRGRVELRLRVVDIIG